MLLLCYYYVIIALLSCDHYDIIMLWCCQYYDIVMWLSWVHCVISMLLWC